MKYEYFDGQETVKVDQTYYTYAEIAYEYNNVKITAPENANEYELVDVDWNN
jgi:hypothetical protein